MNARKLALMQVVERKIKYLKRDLADLEKWVEKMNKTMLDEHRKDKTKVVLAVLANNDLIARKMKAISK